MKELKGTERQIKFATDIRNYVIYQVENFDKLDKTKVERFIKALNNQGSAKFIIDTFVDTFKTKKVRATALDYFKYEELVKVTQKELKGFKNRALTVNELEKDLLFETEKLERKEVKKEEIKKEVKNYSKAQKDYIEKLVDNMTKKPYIALDELKKFKDGEGCNC